MIEKIVTATLCTCRRPIAAAPGVLLRLRNPEQACKQLAAHNARRCLPCYELECYARACTPKAKEQS